MVEYTNGIRIKDHIFINAAFYFLGKEFLNEQVHKELGWW